MYTFEICSDSKFVQNTKFIQIRILFKTSKFVQIRILFKIQNLFRFLFCSKFKICSDSNFVQKFEICSDSNFVQNWFFSQNCSKFKIVQNRKLFKLEFCSKSKFVQNYVSVQIRNYSVFWKEKRKKEKTGKLLNALTGSGLWAKLYRGVLLMRANARRIGVPGS
jgi:hypothetical protein